MFQMIPASEVRVGNMIEVNEAGWTVKSVQVGPGGLVHIFYGFTSRTYRATDLVAVERGRGWDQ